MTKRKSTIFAPSKYKKASREISIESPENAIASVGWLEAEWKHAKTRAHKVRLKKFAVLAANRARALTKKRNISSSEKAQLNHVYKIYRSFVNEYQLDKK